MGVFYRDIRIEVEVGMDAWVVGQKDIEIRYWVSYQGVKDIVEELMVYAMLFVGVIYGNISQGWDVSAEYLYDTLLITIDDTTLLS